MYVCSVVIVYRSTYVCSVVIVYRSTYVCSVVIVVLNRDSSPQTIAIVTVLNDLGTRKFTPNTVSYICVKENMNFDAALRY